MITRLYHVPVSGRCYFSPGMTNNSKKVRRSGALVGVVGEYRAAACLRALGWDRRR